MARKLDKAIDALLDAEELSPALRAKAGELQTAVAEIDREIAPETATLKGRTAVGEWREARRYLMDVDVAALWRGSTVAEQREVLSALFSRLEAGPEGMIFHVKGLPFPVEIPWQKNTPGKARGALVMVAGARTEASAPLPTSNALVLV